jgi:hypothetical protein
MGIKGIYRSHLTPEEGCGKTISMFLHSMDSPRRNTSLFMEFKQDK